MHRLWSNLNLYRLQNVLTKALQKDINSTEYSRETNNVIQEAINCIKTAPDRETVVQIVIGIYNWISTGYDFCCFEPELPKYSEFLKSFHINQITFTTWPDYFKEVAQPGIILAPDKFIKKADAAPLLKGTPLSNLQNAIQTQNLGIFDRDDYDRNHAPKGAHTKMEHPQPD